MMQDREASIMGFEKTICLPAVTESMSKILEFAEQSLLAASISPKTINVFLVALDEMCSNVINYGFEDSPGEITVKLESVDSSSIKVSVLDNGTPFNPIEAKEPDITLTAEERPIGGLGILLVKKTMDEVAYEYKDGHNCLYMTKIVQEQ